MKNKWLQDLARDNVEQIPTFGVITERKTTDNEKGNLHIKLLQINNFCNI